LNQREFYCLFENNTVSGVTFRTLFRKSPADSCFVRAVIKERTPEAAQHHFSIGKGTVITACAAIFENEVRATLREKKRPRKTGIS